MMLMPTYCGTYIDEGTGGDQRVMKHDGKPDRSQGDLFD